MLVSGATAVAGDASFTAVAACTAVGAHTGFVITRDVAKVALAVYDVDELGLDRLDRGVLTALTRSFGGGPVGVSRPAVAVGEEATTVEDVCEPFLVRAGMIARTPRGRLATPQAWTHLPMTPPLRASGLGQPGLLFE